jgi:hypothetical protein
MNETKKRSSLTAPKSQPYVTNYEEHVMKIDLKMRGKERRLLRSIAEIRLVNCKAENAIATR